MRPFKITEQITGDDSDSLVKYFREINKERLITVAEEASLARRVRLGDDQAIEALVKANLRFVVAVAKSFQNRGLPLTDLISEGNIGLIKAAKRFDETRGFKLISYAVWWIRQSIMLAIEEKSRLVRLPGHVTGISNKVHSTFIRMEQELQREPSYKEVEEEIGVSTEMIEDIMRCTLKQISIESPLARTDNMCLKEMIEDKDEENTADLSNNFHSLRKDIDIAISSLPTDEADVLRLHFGLNDKDTLNYRIIGSQLGFRSSKVRKLKERALLSLKQNPRFKYLKEYLR